MPVIDQQRISDGFLTLERGIDAGKSPNLLPRNQASLAVNATMRGGYVKTRIDENGEEELIRLDD